MPRDFEAPPVTEALIGVEFFPLGLGLVRLAHLYDIWRDQLPNASENTTLSPSVANGQPAFMPPIQFSTGVPPVRLWFTSEDQEWLLQVQDDRLVLNWRKQKDQPYPRFGALLARFHLHLQQFGEYIANVGLGPISFNVVEFTYFNRLERIQDYSQFYAIFTQDPPELPGKTLITRFDQVRDVESSKYGSPGQITISSQPVIDDRGEATQLTITTKIFSSVFTGYEQAIELAREAHAFSRSTFDALTTLEAQRNQWGLK